MEIQEEHLREIIKDELEKHRKKNNSKLSRNIGITGLIFAALIFIAGYLINPNGGNEAELTIVLLMVLIPVIIITIIISIIKLKKQSN